MFLANNESPAPWAYHAKYALILPLERVLAHCKWLSIPEEGIYLIDAENLDSFTDGFTDIKIKLMTFIMMCANTNRQIIRYLRKDLIPPIVAPSEQQLADDALREIAAQLHNQKTICNTKDTPIAMLPDGERDDDADYLYLLYTLTANNQLTYYRSENPRQTIRRKKQLAEVFTKVEAQAKTMFPDEDGCMWHAEKVNKVIAEEANKNVIDGLKQTFGDNPKLVTLPKEEQPEAKKRVGYVLYRLDSSGEKYYHFCKQSFNFEFKGKPVYIATNKIWADFKASALSSGDFGMPAWQVEEIEF